MIRFALPAAAVLALAACGDAAEESDEPGTTPAPAPSMGTAPEDGAPAPVAVAEPGAVASVSPPSEFAACGVCHKVEPGGRSLGPSLAGVYGAKAGHVGDFAYSAAMRGSGLTWDEATLDRYLEAPMKTVPGTKMSYAGLKDPAKRKAVIAYLKTL